MNITLNPIHESILKTLATSTNMSLEKYCSYILAGHAIKAAEIATKQVVDTIDVATPAAKENTPTASKPSAPKEKKSVKRGKHPDWKPQSKLPPTERDLKGPPPPKDPSKPALGYRWTDAQRLRHRKTMAMVAKMKKLREANPRIQQLVNAHGGKE